LESLGSVPTDRHGRISVLQLGGGEAPILCQSIIHGDPLIVPAATVDASWAAQPDFCMALVGKIGRPWSLADTLIQSV